MVIASELKPGMFLRIEREIYRVLEAESKARSAKLGGVVKTKLCNVTSGRMWEPHFRPQERLEDLEVERHVSSRQTREHRRAGFPTRGKCAIG